MNKDKLIIIGNGGHAKSCIEVIESLNKYEIVGLVSDKKDLEIKIGKYSTIGTSENISKFKEITNKVVFGIASQNSLNLRQNTYNLFKSNGFIFEKIISSSSIVSDTAKIGEGVIIMQGCIINRDVEIGLMSSINSNTLIEHDSKIGRFCNISTSVTINGNVLVEDDSFIGSGCVIRNNLKIKKNSFLKMGTTVLK